MNGPKMKMHTLAVAVLTALGAGSVQAQKAFDMMLDLESAAAPTSTARVGVGALSDDNRYTGQYSGFVDHGEAGGKLILDLDVISRDAESGTWFKAGVDDNGRAHLEYGPQGDWDARVDYQRTRYRNPRMFNTGLDGIGTDTQATAGVPLRDADMEIDRDDLKLAVKKYLPAGFDIDLKFRQMTRNGDRQWGAQGFNFLAEPIDQETREYEAALSYTGERLQYAVGYYGTSFENEEEVLFNDSAQSEISLPLDSRSHQFYISGNMVVTPSSRVNFKVSRSTVESDEDFYKPAEANGRTELDGEIKNTIAYVSANARLLDALSLVGSVRYEEREDNTPVDTYFNRADDAGTPDVDESQLGLNVPHSREQLKWKLDAAYRLPMGFTLTGGFEAEGIDRTVPPVRQVSFREETDEQTWHVGLRRMFGETLNGALSFSSSDRDGSDYLVANSNAAADVLGARHLKDRQRDKWKLQLDWMPSEPLSLQFVFQMTDDDYSGRTHGPSAGETTLLSLDAAYRVNDDWTVTAWAMRDQSEIDQSTNGDNDDNSISNTDWMAALAHTGNSFGLGVRGLVAFQHRVGADIQYGKDTSEHGIAITGNGVASLADIEYKYLRLSLFGEYVLDESSGIRLDYFYEKHQNDDWAYNGWVYADGTTVTIEDDEDVHFIGLSYFKKWY